jgi:spermidine synthase
MTHRVPVSVFFALFTVSGFAGLIYESIWSHYLKLFLGHAAYAQTLVLAIFMGGMALGAWLVSRYTLRIRNLLVGYAIAELGIGVLALVFHGVFNVTTGWALNSLFPALGGTGLVDLVKWLIASLLILPASVLLGTTFPLMSAGVMRLYPESGGRALAMLYFTNSLGAAIGVLASGFILIGAVGLPGTILTAGIMNIALALTVWVIAKRLAPAVAPGIATNAPGLGALPPLARAILLAAFATGAASFIYEITWIRMLTTGLGASTHAFEVMLAAFILGMSLGSLVLRGRIERIGNDVAWLAAIVIAKALLAVYAVWIYDDVLEFIRWMMQATARTNPGYAVVTTAGFLASMIVMFPTAFCAGMSLPLATHALTRRGLGEASIGRLYAANTAGCIVGAAFATHIGMEWLGVKNLTGLGAFVDVAVALLILAVGTAREARGRALAVAGGIAAVGLVAFLTVQLDLLRMSSGVFRYGAFEDPRTSSVKFYRDGKTASIAVTESTQTKRRAIRTNGKTDAAMRTEESLPAGPDESTMVLAAAVPLAMKPDAAVVANIGFGSGLTTHALLGSPRVKEVDSIEIERMMIEGARLFLPRNSRAYEDPRSHIHIDDAKTFFASQGKRYDIIVSEPSNPWVSGVATLFSHEFYGQVRGHLKPDGILVQWIQAYDMNVDLLASIFKALGSRFGDYAVYRVGGAGFDLLIVATPGKALPRLSPELFSFPGLSADLQRLGYLELDDLKALRIGGRAAVGPFFERDGFPMNSDFFPILDQRAPLARYRGDSAQELTASRDSLVPVAAMLDEETRTPVRRIAIGGLNRPIRVDRALIGSEMIGAFLTGNASLTRVLSGDERAAALLAQSLMERCEGSEAEWTNAISEVVGLSAPFLERADVGIVFEKAKASRCWKSLPEDARNRILLLEAINNRDPAAMRRHGEAVLERLPPTAEAARRVALMTALTGHVVGGTLAEGRALWSRHAPHLLPETLRSYPMRLLQAHLTSRP